MTPRRAGRELDKRRRPTLAELEYLKAPILVAPAGLLACRVISGRAEDLERGESLQGGQLFQPIEVKSSAGSRWRWTLCAKGVLTGYPCWDGIHQGDEVTIGHIQALKDAGELR